jgi:hypothetical protein
MTTSFTALEKAKHDMALDMQELAEASGYGYWTVRQWKKSGLPLISGKITLRDARAWLKKQSKQDGDPKEQTISPAQAILSHPLHPNADRSRYLPANDGSASAPRRGKKSA